MMNQFSSIAAKYDRATTEFIVFWNEPPPRSRKTDWRAVVRRALEQAGAKFIEKLELPDDGESYKGITKAAAEDAIRKLHLPPNVRGCFSIE